MCRPCDKTSASINLLLSGLVTGQRVLEAWLSFMKNCMGTKVRSVR
jgi:hypothetical protein